MSNYKLAEKIYELFKEGQDQVLVKYDETNDPVFTIVNEKQKGNQYSLIQNLYSDIANSYKYEAVNTIVRQIHQKIAYWEEFNKDGGEVIALRNLP
jgi:hypothetical protein